MQSGGFTLIEILVVMVIVAILMALAVWGIAGSRASGRWVGATTAAQAYADAADDFARDHNGRYPAGPGSGDWPSSPASELIRGPRAAALGTRGTYLRRVPESIQDRSITIGSTPSSMLRYVQMADGGTPGSGYRIEIRVLGRPACAVYGGQSAPVPGLRRCSER